MITKNNLPKEFQVKCNNSKYQNKKVFNILVKLRYYKNNKDGDGILYNYGVINNNIEYLYSFNESIQEITYKEFLNLIGQEEEKLYTIEDIKKGGITILCEIDKEYEILHNCLKNNLDWRIKGRDYGKTMVWYYENPNYYSYDYQKTSHSNGYKQPIIINFNQIDFKEDKMEKEIIGYKAPFDMYGGKIKKGDILDQKNSGGKLSYSINDFIHYVPKEIVEQWEPAYKEKYILPKINNYEGRIEGDYIVYGSNCAKFNIEFFKGLQNINESINIDEGANRTIKSIELSSGVKITIEEINQICQYLENV